MRVVVEAEERAGTVEPDEFRIYEPEAPAPPQGERSPQLVTRKAPAPIPEGRPQPRIALVKMDTAIERSEIEPPSTRTPGARLTAPTAQSSNEIPTEIEQEMLAILGSAPDRSETIEAAFRRREHALGEVFALLTPPQARELHRRLLAVRSGDRLAALFGRMVEARRARLLAFLADAPRRDAIARARR